MPENVGAIGSVDSPEKSGHYGDAGESANALDDAAKPVACSSVARGPRPAGLLPAIEAAIEALDAADFEAARAPLRAVAAERPGKRRKSRTV